MNSFINWDALSKMCFIRPTEDAPYDPAVAWGKVATMYDGMAKLEKEFTLNQVNAMILSKEDSVVDIGCGSGRLSVPIAQRVKPVTSVDVADEMLAKCKEKCKSCWR